MPGLGDAAAISAGRRLGAPTLNGGGRLVETLDFGANPGRLRMLSFVPASVSGRRRTRAPLVVALHGCGQAAEDYAHQAGWVDLAGRRGFAVLAPAQPRANNRQGCFNWFARQHLSRGQGEAASIAAMIGFMIEAHGLDRTRVFITGLSAGGAMALAMLAAYPELFAAGAVIAGLPYGVAASAPEALMAMCRASRRSGADLARLLPARGGGRIPRLSIWQGTADRVVAPGNAAAIARQWAASRELGEAPDETTVMAGRSRSLWRCGQTGEIVLELNLIRGLGHGAPLATGGSGGLGQAGPYMLEAGVSSSLEIADYWGLAAAAPSPWTATSPADPARKGSRPAPPGDPGGKGVAAELLARLSRRLPRRLRAALAGVLRRAGIGPR